MPRKRNKSNVNASGGLVIANMGLFWLKDRVTWRGTRSGRSVLLGVSETARRAGAVDFWEQTGVYALYADYRLVYVGQAGMSDKSCIGKRLKQHTKGELVGRWNMFSWFGLRRVNTTLKLAVKPEIRNIKMGPLANVLEGILIEVAEPPLNKQKGRFGTSVHRFLQYYNPQLPSKPLTNADLKAELRKFRTEIQKPMKKGRKIG